MKENKNSLIGGVAILSVAGLISKVIGMFFRIPLGNMIGSGGMGIYQAVYTTYTLLLVISTAGVPVAISRLVSESVAVGRPREARAVLRVSLALLAVLGAALSPLLVIFAGPLAARMGDAEAAAGFIAIAPSILVVSLISAFRGYLQGRSRMVPTGISQLIEQLAKVVLSYPLAYVGMQRYGVTYAAAGALLGISIGEGIALVYMVIVYGRARRTYAGEEREDPVQPTSAKALTGRIIAIAIPVTLGALTVPITGFVDSAMVRVRLLSAGFDVEQARSLYGLLTGYAQPLVNVPTVLAQAVCIGLVPGISASRVEGRLAQLRETGNLGLRLSSLISFPCAVGIWMMAPQIMRLLYPALPADELRLAGDILGLGAWTVILFTQVQASTGILQGAGMQRVPAYSLLVGVTAKVALNYALVGIPRVNVFGAPIASMVCFGISAVINIVCIVRGTGMRLDVGGVVLRPAAATAGMGAVLYGMTRLLDMDRSRNVVLAIAAAVLAYAALAVWVGALRREDLAQVSGGARIERLFVRLRLWR